MVKQTKSKLPKITAAEWEVLDVLWERGPVSASQVATSLKSRTGWSLGAVRTFLTRLIHKGTVRILDDEPINRYEAVYDRETFVHRESHGFLDKYFDGTFHLMLASYLKHENVSPAEIARLKRLLDEREKGDEPL
jgi:BlaI family penicillinase repressor